MPTRLDQTWKVGQDNLIADFYPPVYVTTAEVSGNQGILERGTLIVCDSEMKNGAPVSSAITSEQAPFVVCDPVDTGEDDAINIAVYSSGNFQLDELITSEEYELTRADIQKLRVNGIFVQGAMPLLIDEEEE